MTDTATPIAVPGTAAAAQPFGHLPADLNRVHQRLNPEVAGYEQLTTMLRQLFGGVPKLVRPTLSLMAAYLSDGGQQPANDRVIDAAALVELLHVGTLCHDDVMDNADTRRGRPSTPAQWGNNLAILGGDHLLALGSEMASALGAREAVIVSRTLRALVDGQMIETVDRHNPHRTEESYYAAITGKSAELLACACELGALEAGASDAQAAALHRFGLEFGIAFQINDDVLDLVQTAEHLGKPAGNDVLAGVYTLPVLYAMARRPALRETLAKPVTAAQIDEIKAVVRDCGALDSAGAAARDHLNQSLAALAEAGYDGAATQAVIDFAMGLLGASGLAGVSGEHLFYRAASVDQPAPGADAGLGQTPVQPG